MLDIAAMLYRHSNAAPGWQVCNPLL